MAAPKDNPPELDEVYGLEPVFEPASGEAAAGTSASLQPRTVQCPYCGETFETMVDLSSGSMSYIEDCQVCCQPIEFNLEVENERTAGRLRVGRGD